MQKCDKMTRNHSFTARKKVAKWKKHLSFCPGRRNIVPIKTIPVERKEWQMPAMPSCVKTEKNHSQVMTFRSSIVTWQQRQKRIQPSYARASAIKSRLAADTWKEYAFTISAKSLSWNTISLYFILSVEIIFKAAWIGHFDISALFLLIKTAYKPRNNWVWDTICF